MSQAKDIVVNVAGVNETFVLLTPGNADKPAEWRFKSSTQEPAFNLPYVTAKGTSVKSNKPARRAKLVVIVPVIRDGKRVDQHVVEVTSRISLMGTPLSAEQAVKRALAIASNAELVTALQNGATPG